MTPTLRNTLGTYLIVTAGTLLIWFWAASKTKEDATLFIRVRFAVEGAARWRVDPLLRSVNVNVEGSARSIDNAEQASRDGLTIVLPDDPGTVTVDLIDRLRRSEVIRDTGVTLLSAEPAAIDVVVDRMQPIEAAVRTELPPGIQTDGPIEIMPPTATVWVPTQRSALLPSTLVVNAYLPPNELERLEPGGRYTVQARLQLPDSVPMSSEMTIEPSTATLTMNVRSRIRQTTLESVRVHLAGPHEDFLEYEIELNPSVLRNVTIEADSELVRQIASGQANVVAILHLSNRDKEQGIPSKSIAYFAAFRDGWTRGTQVTAQIDGAEGMPEIGLVIRRRN